MLLKFRLKSTHSYDYTNGTRCPVRISDYSTLASSFDPLNAMRSINADKDTLEIISEFYRIGLSMKTACGGCALEYLNENQSGSRINIMSVPDSAKYSAVLIWDCLLQMRNPMHNVGIDQALDESFIRWANRTKLNGEITLHIMADKTDTLYPNEQTERLNITSVDGSPLPEFCREPMNISDFDISRITPESEMSAWKLNQNKINGITEKGQFLICLKLDKYDRITSKYEYLLPGVDPQSYAAAFIGKDTRYLVGLVTRGVPYIRRLYLPQSDTRCQLVQSFVSSGADAVPIPPSTALELFHLLYGKFGKPLTLKKSIYLDRSASNTKPTSI